MVLAVHAPGLGAVGARPRPAHAVDQVRHFAIGVEDELWPLSRRDSDGASRAATRAGCAGPHTRPGIVDLDLRAIRRDG